MPTTMVSSRNESSTIHRFAALHGSPVGAIGIVTHCTLPIGEQACRASSVFTLLTAVSFAKALLTSPR